MDLQLRKIHFVQEFLRLNNEGVLGKLELLLKNEKKKLYTKEIKPFTTEEFNTMIDQAEEDSKANKVKEARQLRNEIDSWI